MSADLFAEFNDLSSDSAPAPNSTPDQPSNLPTARAQTPGWSGDLLTLGHARSSPQSNSQPFSNWGVSRPQPSVSDTWTAFSQPAPPSDPAAADDDDGWGDFEVADSAPLPIVSHGHPPVEPTLQKSAPSQGVSGATTANPRSQISRTEKQQPPAPSKSSIPSWPQPQKRPKTQLQGGPDDPSVLFDADDFELSGGDVEVDEGDEFGDFATAAPPSPRLGTVGASTLALAPSIDLLGLEDGPQQLPRKRTGSFGEGALGFGASPSSHTRPFSDKVLEENSSDAKAKSSSSAIAWTSSAAIDGVQTTKDEDDEWGAWDADTLPRPVAGSPQLPDNWNWDVVDSSKPSITGASNDAPPPINIPPPSVILSAFPDILNSGTSLLKPLAAQNKSVKQQVLSDPQAVRFLQGYALLGTTAAKVIAGRKLRWHRDKMLTKSMSISTAGSKGMKLAGVDKAQSAREDRESAEVVAAWREHVGRLRAAIATANASGKAKLRVPELSENMQIQTAKMVPTARGPCLICGLKREERVARVDSDVEDSFGEWWVEHWGHRACKNFWLEHEQRLRQR